MLSFYPISLAVPQFIFTWCHWFIQAILFWVFSVDAWNKVYNGKYHPQKKKNLNVKVSISPKVSGHQIWQITLTVWRKMIFWKDFWFLLGHTQKTMQKKLVHMTSTKDFLMYKFRKPKSRIERQTDTHSVYSNYVND